MSSEFLPTLRTSIFTRRLNITCWLIHLAPVLDVTLTRETFARRNISTPYSQSYYDQVKKILKVMASSLFTEDAPRRESGLSFWFSALGSLTTLLDYRVPIVLTRQILQQSAHM